MKFRALVAKVLRLDPTPETSPEIPPGALCPCGAPASHQWYPNVCALAGEKIEWVPVCTACDVALNEVVVRMTYGDSHEEALEAYRRSEEQDE